MIIEFSMLGVPINWSNYMVNRFVIAEKKREWLESTTILARVARVKAGIPIAEKGHSLRIIQIHQIRTRLLDKDGLYVSCKPIVDGLKSELKRKVEKKFVTVSGAGLIFNDNPSHCDWECTQELASGRDQKVTIRINIEED
jgi:hypothetical protein